jgi:hypothetical protein
MKLLPVQRGHSQTTLESCRMVSLTNFCQDLLHFVIWKVADRIQILGSGSDHSAFAFYAGVPAVYLRFEPDTQKYKGKQRCSTYNSKIIKCAVNAVQILILGIVVFSQLFASGGGKIMKNLRIKATNLRLNCTNLRLLLDHC